MKPLFSRYFNFNACRLIEGETGKKSLIKNSREILSLLSELKQKKTPIRFASPATKALPPLFISEINPKTSKVVAEFFTPVNDLSGVNKTSLTLTANIDGVDCFLTIGFGVILTYNNMPAIGFKIPTEMSWIQRRANLRTVIPAAHDQSYCEIKLFALQGKLIKLPLVDLNTLGFSFQNKDEALIEHFEVGSCFHGLIHLQSGEYNCVQFKVKHINRPGQQQGSMSQSIGCEFTNIGFCFEAQIQKYIQSIQICQASHGDS